MHTIIFCVLIADFITGFVHWFEDTYITPDWPILGKHVGVPNIQHHKHPGWIGTMSSFVSRNMQTFSMGAVFIVTYLFFYGWFIPVVFTIAVASLGNEIHTWNHRTRNKNPFWIRLLQDTCIVQTPYQHAKHHKKPYDTCYCTITNILNPILDSLNFWRSLEYILWITFGFEVQRGGMKREGL
jgi:ubiquitin-conjugating enzyme E2 variant